MRENGRLSPGEILKYCPLGLEEQEFLEQASEQAGLSMRGCHRVIRVARTIADLEGKDRIGVEHLGQALFSEIRMCCGNEAPRAEGSIE